MIHFISGKLVSLTSDRAIIECSGVGFSVGISVATCSRLAPYSGKNVTVYTYMSVSEDDISLFGFAAEDELELFKKLISVSGIGPKGGMSILGTLTPDAFRSAVANNDAKAISHAPGVGLKTAQKLIIELKDKLGAVGEDFSFDGGDTPQSGEKLSQVVDTLVLYGFPRARVTEALKRQDTSLPLEELISATLRTLGKEAGI